MAETKKKRLTIREQLKEIKDMQEASRRRQKGEKVTSDQVTSVRRRAEAEAKSNERKQSEGGGMGKPKPKPKPAAQPVKPSSVKPQVAKPQSGPKGGDAPAKPADPAPVKGKKTLPPGAPDPKDPKYAGHEGFKRYVEARKAWERKQKEGKRPTRRAGESNASFNRRLQAYLRRNR